MILKGFNIPKEAAFCFLNARPDTPVSRAEFCFIKDCVNKYLERSGFLKSFRIELSPCRDEIIMEIRLKSCALNLPQTILSYYEGENRIIFNKNATDTIDYALTMANLFSQADDQSIHFFNARYRVIHSLPTDHFQLKVTEITKRLKEIRENSFSVKNLKEIEREVDLKLADLAA